MNQKSNKTENEEKKKIINVINWNSGVNLTNKDDGNKDFLRYGSMVSSYLNENSTKIIMTRNGILKNLVVELVTSTDTGNAFPGDGTTRVFTIRKNGHDTPVSVLISDQNDYGETQNESYVTKNDLISLSHHVIGKPINDALAIASIELY